MKRRERTKTRTRTKAEELALAVAATEHNARLLREVWAGRKGRAALMFEDEGGEARRVGWPDGYRAPRPI